MGLKLIIIKWHSPRSFSLGFTVSQRERERERESTDSEREREH